MGKFHKHRVAILATLAVELTAVAQARAADFKLFVVREILIPDARDATCGNPARQSLQKALVAGLRDRELTQRFIDAMSKNFTTAAKIESLDRFNTFAVALQINRVSRYAIDKNNGNSDVYVPVTASLYFTDVTTGKILYSYSVTNYAFKTVSNASVDSEATTRELIGVSFDGALSRLIGKASANFHPFNRTFKIADRQSGVYLIAAGAKDGLAPQSVLDDGKTGLLSIAYLGDDYAVAEKMSGQIDPSSDWHSTSNGELADLNKPLVYVTATIKGDRCDPTVEAFDPSSVQQQFTDAIGDSSPFSVTSISPEYGKLIEHVTTENSKFDDKHVREHVALPEYYAFLTVERPIVADLPTNIAHKRQLKVSETASLRITDIKGRVVYADTASETLSDEVVSGVGFDPSSRAEVALRNTFTDLAARARKNLKFQKLRIPVTSAKSDAVSLNDPLGQLNMDDSITLLHGVTSSRLTSRSGLFIPIAAGSVQEVDGPKVEAVLLPPDTPREVPVPARAGDIAELDAAAGGSGGLKRPLDMCGGEAPLGSIAVDGFDEAALAALTAAGITGVHQRAETDAVIRELDTDHRHKFSPEPASEAGVCIKPVYKIESAGATCDGSKVCSQKLSIKAGFRVLKGQTVVLKMALDQNVTTQSYLASTPAEVVSALVASDAHAYAAGLLLSLAKDKGFQGVINTLK